MQENLYKIIKNFSSLIFDQIVYKILSFIMLIVAARFLGTIGFGQLSYTLSFIWIFWIVADSGLTDLFIRDVSAKRELLERPDIVLVYGDTNSTLVGAIAAAKLCIPIAHVEAGMRSYNRDMPEEINRVVDDQLSSIPFCSSKNAYNILKSESITKNVHLVGDVMFDSLKDNLSIAEKKSRVLSVLNIQPKRYYLTTIHRAINTDNPKRLKNILNILNSLDLPVIIPLHPRTRNILHIHKKNYFNKNLRIIESLSYLDMFVLEKNSKIILTDSGGVQKEVFFLNVPCITLREETEWMETVDSGWNIFVDVDKQKIIKAIQQFKNKLSYAKKKYYYGRGKASQKIIQILFRKRIG